MYRYGECFALNGARPGVRNAWAAIDRAGGIVVLANWQDGFFRTPDGRWLYSNVDPVARDWKTKPLNFERAEYLRYAQRHLGGEFRAFITVATDETKVKVRVSEYVPGLRLRLIELRETGEFVAMVLSPDAETLAAILDRLAQRH